MDIVTDANAVLQEVVYALPIPLPTPYDILEFRFGLTQDPIFNTTYMAVGLQGDFVPIFNPSTPPLPPPTLPSFNQAFSSTYLQLYLSSYSAVSAIYSLYSAGLLTWYLPSTSIPFGFNSTTAYGLVAPQLPTLFPNSDVCIYLLAGGMPTFTVLPSGVTGSAPLLIGFNVNTSTWGNDTYNAFVLEAQLAVAVDLSLLQGVNNSMTLDVDIGYVATNVSLATSNVGTVNAALMSS